MLPLTVIEVEALAARRGVELALELGLNSVELEGDSTGLINTFMDGCKSLAHYSHIVADIHYLASQFSIFNLSHVRRHCNKVAYSLVRRAILPPRPPPPLSIYMEDVPPDITHVLHVDFNNLPQ